MNTILVPIDFSQNSPCNFNYGLELARATKARLVLVHVFYPIMSPPAAYNATDVIQALERGKKRELELFADAILETSSPGKTGQEVDVLCVAKLGVADEQILEVAQDYKADLVVMGLQGSGAWSQTIIGSTTLSIIRSRVVPVLALPKGCLFKSYSSVVFANNLGETTSEAVLNTFQNIIQPFNAKVSVLHLYKQDKQKAVQDVQDAIEVIKERFYNLDYKIYIQQSDDVALGILDCVQKQQADLVVLIPQKHTLLERLLDKSVTGRMAAFPTVPLLTLPNQLPGKTNKALNSDIVKVPNQLEENNETITVS